MIQSNDTTYSDGNGITQTGNVFSTSLNNNSDGLTTNTAAGGLVANLNANVVIDASINTANDTLVLTKEDGNTVNFADDFRHVAFTGATTNVAGNTGLVPAPSAGEEDEYLRGDGT